MCERVCAISQKQTRNRDVCLKLKLKLMVVVVVVVMIACILFRRRSSFLSLSVLALSSTPIGWVCESFFCFFIFCYSFFICFPFFSVFFSTFVLLRVYPASTSRSIQTLACSVSIFPSFFWLALVCQRSLCMLMCVCVCGIIYMPVLHKSTHISLSLYTHTRTLSLVHTLRHLDSVARGYCLLLLL